MLAGALVAWTALLCLMGKLAGLSFSAAPLPPQPRRPLGLGGPSRSLLSASSLADSGDDQLERRWTEKLLGDLQSAAADESVSATLSELRSTLDAREERLLQQRPLAGTPRARASAAQPSATTTTTATPIGSSSSSIEVPHYDRTSVADLQKAALAAAMPSEVRGPLPQLVRDLGAALAKQQAEQEALQRRLSQLQPAVINYNPADVEQLTKVSCSPASPVTVTVTLTVGLAVTVTLALTPNPTPTLPQPLTPTPNPNA